MALLSHQSKLVVQLVNYAGFPQTVALSVLSAPSGMGGPANITTLAGTGPYVTNSFDAPFEVNKLLRFGYRVFHLYHYQIIRCWAARGFHLQDYHKGNVAEARQCSCPICVSSRMLICTCI